MIYIVIFFDNPKIVLCFVLSEYKYLNLTYILKINHDKNLQMD